MRNKERHYAKQMTTAMQLFNQKKFVCHICQVSGLTQLTMGNMYFENKAWPGLRCAPCKKRTHPMNYLHFIRFSTMLLGADTVEPDSDSGSDFTYNDDEDSDE